MLCVRSRGNETFEMEEHLAALARIARDSKEYQGHGWGCAWLENAGAGDDGIQAHGPDIAGSPRRRRSARWRFHHDIAPIWEDAARPAGRTTLLVAHARSAFRDEGIRVENNMPFTDGERVFAFNGELHGVRIRERGRIGAEKVFNFVKRFDRGDFTTALTLGLDAIERRTRYMRATNLVVADRARRVHFASRFSEDPEYFQMHTAIVDGARVLCSEPYPGTAARVRWTPVANGQTGTL
ncbi:MAG: hypothetical protein F4087_05055 [Gemmatimonadetes bacterium]|nr:hypothetical protein [Gemmatimonadota bacterium]MYJ67868.1 hypothetical protein [Gemmatimonadota bacterium]